MPDWEDALEHWGQADANLEALAREYGPQPLVFVDDSHFESLLRSVCHQQVSMASGKAIHARVVDLGIRTPRGFLDQSFEDLRGAGLSRSKVRTLQGVAEAMEEGLFDPVYVGRQDSQDAVQAWTQFWGIGPWTAKMLLLFHDGHPNLLAHEDLGVRIAETQHLGAPEDDAKRWAWLRDRESVWGPYNSLATRVLWQSLEGEPLDAP